MMYVYSIMGVCDWPQIKAKSADKFLTDALLTYWVRDASVNETSRAIHVDIQIHDTYLV